MGVNTGSYSTSPRLLAPTSPNSISSTYDYSSPIFSRKRKHSTLSTTSLSPVVDQANNGHYAPRVVSRISSRGSNSSSGAADQQQLRPVKKQKYTRKQAKETSSSSSSSSSSKKTGSKKEQGKTGSKVVTTGEIVFDMDDQAEEALKIYKQNRREGIKRLPAENTEVLHKWLFANMD